MERFYTGIVASWVRTYWLVAGFLLLATVLLLLVRLNAESYNFGHYEGDEYHTVHQGLNLLVNGEVENFRAQEGVRWLVRAFYPYALVYMNTHMGGNVYLDGWAYPGHNYIVQNFVNQDVPSEVSADPNVRLMLHALREAYIAFVFTAIVALLLFFFRKKYYVVAFGGVLLLGASLDLLTEQKIFYIEPAILASLAFMLLTYCYSLFAGQTGRGITLLFGFLSAFMVSTKFSTILFIALPIVLFFYLLHRKEALRHTALYIASLVGSYLLINFPAFMSLERFNLFLHDLFSNFWQYSAGSDSGITVASGIPHLSLLVYQLEGLLGYALYVLPLIIPFALYYANAKERIMLVPLGILVCLSVVSLVGQHVYLTRNLIPFYLPIVLVSLLSIEIVARSLVARYGRRYLVGGIAALTLLWLGGVAMHAGGITSFTTQLFPSAKAGIKTELESLHRRSPAGVEWYAVGFPRNFFEEEVYEDRIVIKENAPSALSNKNYPVLAAEYSTLPRESVVLVNNVGNNKHLATYLLPKYFGRNIQYGSYYVFFNER